MSKKCEHLKRKMQVMVFKNGDEHATDRCENCGNNKFIPWEVLGIGRAPVRSYSRAEPTKVNPFLLSGLRIVASSAVPEGEIWVSDSQMKKIEVKITNIGDGK